MICMRIVQQCVPGRLVDDKSALDDIVEMEKIAMD